MLLSVAQAGVDDPWKAVGPVVAVPGDEARVAARVLMSTHLDRPREPLPDATILLRGNEGVIIAFISDDNTGHRTFDRLL
ncbi:hypothetical protein [Bradyrhizobium sp. DASA03120]|uniref:hypothetical protein n=1 Tax=Bradyrhizobium sp. SMVTL-02 TaxID=3395917 RepID=UPI003F71C8FB